MILVKVRIVQKEDPPLTPRQREVLRAIFLHYRAHGFAPRVCDLVHASASSVRGVARTGVRTTSGQAVRDHLRALETKRYVECLGQGPARRIRLLRISRVAARAPVGV